MEMQLPIVYFGARQGREVIMRKLAIYVPRRVFFGDHEAVSEIPLSYLPPVGGENTPSMEWSSRRRQQRHWLDG